MECVLTGDELAQLIPKYKIIVPKRRNYYIESLYSHYAHTHYAEHLDITREIISEKYPDYLESFDKVMKQTGGYMFKYVYNGKISDQTHIAAGCLTFCLNWKKRSGRQRVFLFPGKILRKSQRDHLNDG